MENFSDIPEKKTPGRPKKWVYFDNPSLTIYRPDNWTAISRRSQINQELYTRVLDVIDYFNKKKSGDTNYDWLIRWTDGYKKQGMYTVIYALGRFEDPSDIIALVDYICEKQLKSKDALEFIQLYKKLKKEEEQEGTI